MEEEDKYESEDAPDTEEVRRSNVQTLERVREIIRGQVAKVEAECEVERVKKVKGAMVKKLKEKILALQMKASQLRAYVDGINELLKGMEFVESASIKNLLGYLG